MTPCSSIEVLIERRFDGVATAEDEARLDAHLANCPECARLVAAEATVDTWLASRFDGARPSATFDAVLRRRIADERQTESGWIADALNGLGGLLVLVAVAPTAIAWGGAAGVAAATAALVLGVYPLLLTAWASDGSGEREHTRGWIAAWRES